MNCFYSETRYLGCKQKTFNTIQKLDKIKINLCAMCMQDKEM